jgi:hypothetical protein
MIYLSPSANNRIVLKIGHHHFHINCDLSFIIILLDATASIVK